MPHWLSGQAIAARHHLELTMSEAPRQRLLIVDDEEGPRKSLRIIFKNRYEVELAKSGMEAVEIVRRCPVDVAILDIRMPEMDGIATLKAIKAIDPLTEVLMLTAYETIETARQALRLGACDYLNKPFEIDVVEASVATAFDRRAISEKSRESVQKLEALQSTLQEQQVREEIAREKGEIYASVLHDINGPLTIISAFAQTIQRALQQTEEVQGDKLENLRRDLGRVNQQADRCVEISRRYLGFLRSSVGKQQLVPLRQVLEDVRELLRRHPSIKGNELIIHAFEEEACASMNGTDLIQVLLNLTINALQATTDSHRVELVAQRCTTALELDSISDSSTRRVLNRDGFKNTPPLLSITIADNGPGIEPEVLDNMFESYFTTKTERGGTGLGLSIVRRLLKEAGAALVLQTKVGTGTKVTVYVAEAAEG